ncbi:flagellar L-ring protein [Desulfomarina profundi]|uniref:Flagellar L-ring protein n=1 Tax=Desulfomarina profundi TaxID=2772557 RepID=A0A8D5FMX6_9BACT|nr:flagellar basal body L-ring protein FlgH [Desulfomarina profundi]BCL60585.1 flagellar L-ring protein [Desulfomarina profundi]
MNKLKKTLAVSKIILNVLVLVFLTSCASPPPRIATIPEPLEEIKTGDSIAKESGSIWSERNSSMFADRKAKNIGDIVTVLISEQASASKQASTKTDRTTSMSASIPNFFGLENDKIWNGHNPVDLSNLVKADFKNGFDGNGTTTRKEDLTASLTTQVVGKYPNGQLKIRGGKEVMVNNEVQIIYLTGIVRPVDITAANTVSSNKILNARITYTGKGAVSDKQEPGWMMRTLDNIWPF